MEQDAAPAQSEDQVPQTDIVEDHVNPDEATEPEKQGQNEVESEKTALQSDKVEQVVKSEQPDEKTEKLEPQDEVIALEQSEELAETDDEQNLKRDEEEEEIIIHEDEQSVPSAVTTEQSPQAKTEETLQIAIQETFEIGTDEETIPNEEPMEARLALLHTFSSDYFLNKHTGSFRCLEQDLCSKSDLMMATTFFPPLKDPGLDDILYYIPPEEEPDPNGCDKYLNMCKDLTIVPIKRVINSLTTDTLNLKYYGISLNQMRGIADALKVNSYIKYLILQDNWLSPEQCVLLSDVLRESNSIRALNLKECRIGSEGAEKLCEGISSTQFLQELDLSYNSLGDKGLAFLQLGLIENTSIKKLNISHNELTEDSGVTLEAILIENKALEELDLSWNGFFTTAGNKKLGNGLSKNELISWLSLAWNGIGLPGAMRPITKYLRTTKVLRFLDLSWNRITAQALKLLRSALINNKSLNQVKMGNNIYSPDEAHFLATLFSKTNTDNLTFLDMEDMCVNKDFLPLKTEYHKKGKTIIHGHVLSNYRIFGPNINKLLFQRCKYLAMKPKQKKKKKDFGEFVLSLPDKNVSHQDFEQFLKKKKVKKIDRDLLKELLIKFPAKHGKADCIALKAAYMKLYPDTVLPEEKKGKKGKKGRKKGKKAKKKEE